MEDKEQVLPKVCILTSGVGSRLSHRTKNFNKALLRVGDKAVISHTIDEFSDDIEFVIALGYKGDVVKQYLEIAHPEKKFTFIEIDKFVGSGTGPGYSILKCKEYLQCPFYFVSCDSIIEWKTYKNELPWYKQSGIHYCKEAVETDFTDSSRNSWVACALVDESEKEKYCTVIASLDYMMAYIDKSKDGTNFAFTGVAFVKEYEEFWQNLESKKETVDNEIQIAPSILELKNIVPVEVNWFDTGTEERLLKARKKFGGIQNLDKLDEELYVVGGYVIKYFHDSDIVKNRLKRAKLLGDVVPKIVGKSKNFYKYKFVAGRDLFKVPNLHDYIECLLDFSSKTIWKPVHITPKERVQFEEACRQFYYNKTISRLSQLYQIKGNIDSKEKINNQETLSAEQLFELVNWDFLSVGLPVLFHGDTYLGNIILSYNDEFKFIDWRQDFSKLMYGDQYWDLSKIYNSFLIPSISLNSEKYYIQHRESGTIEAYIEIPIEIQLSKRIFEDWIIKNEYNFQKIRILSALGLLSMSPLHEDPLREYLYYFGKYYLQKVLNV